ncbi:enhanced intracellular survival protein Eis [Alkalibacterium putridalgicola]|uniref:GNAT family N-acetyltransferase n=1 Tax=Alkalibacterium putridalgicola TaxID=426703 RepID=UPI0034CEDFB7
MEIRELTNDHNQEIHDLNVYAFRLEDNEETKKWVEDCFANGIAYGAFSEEKLTSSVIVFPFEMYYHGRILKMGGIGNVSSYPEVRGQGTIRQLLEKALEEMRDQGYVLSYLAPFSYRFYRKFGYKVAFEQRQYQIMPEDFGPFEAPENRVERVRYEDQKQTIQSIYQQKVAQSVGPVRRTDWLWEKKFLPSDKKKVALYRDDQDSPKGYLVFEFTGQDQNTFKIHELMALSGTAERSLWDFVSTHSSSFESFTYTGRSDQHLTHLFSEADLKQTMMSHMMARIVDMEDFLKQCPFQASQQQEFWIEVRDVTAEWNNNVFKLSVSEHEVSVTIEEQPGNESRHLKGSIQTWTQLFMQFKTADELQFEGSLAASKETAQALQDILPKGVPELYDYF